MLGGSLHCRLLNGFELRFDDHELTVRGTRCRQVFAFLMLHVDSIVGVERLADALWGDAHPDSPRNSIQRFVSDLRRDLGEARDRVESVGEGYRIKLLPGDSFDVRDLERGLPRAREALDNGRPNEAAAHFDAPAPRSEPLAGLEGAEFATHEQGRLVDLVADAVEVRAEMLLALGQPDEAVTMAAHMLERTPYRERLCTSVATGLSRTGRATDALNTISAFRTRLQTDLGLDPSPLIDQAELDVLLHRDAGNAGSTSSRFRSDGRSRVFGREDLVERAITALGDHGVVTLSGMGGIGKTSLAHAVVDAWNLRHDGGSHFVRLEGVAPTGLIPAIGQAVGTSASSDADALAEVIDRIRADVGLLILDNCEHLSSEVAAVLDELAQRPASAQVLCTSRNPIGVADEHLIAVGPLDEAASRSLLERDLDRASVAIAELNADAVAELLDQLDGLPLAIELAAANLRSIGARELLTRLQAQDPTVQRARTKSQRHASVANALETTLAQLNTGASELLRLASIFPSDFNLAAIEAIAGGSVVEAMQDLVEHALLEVHRTPLDTRYRMLVPVRAEVRARYEQANSHETRALLQHFSSRSVACLDQMKGTGSRQAVSELRAKLTNFAFCFDLALDDGDHESAAILLANVGLANAISPAVGATSHLQDWGERVRTLLNDGEAHEALGQAAAWGLYGSGDGRWYLRWEADTPIEHTEIQAMAAIASFSQGATTEAWTKLRDLDVTATPDPYLRAMLCGVGAVIAYQVDAAAGDALTAAAVEGAGERQSHGASFFARLALSTQAFFAGDGPTSVGLLAGATESLEGHDLVTLENFGRACLMMTAGLLLEERPTVPMLLELLDRYLDQHSLDPASVATTLDVAVLTLDGHGETLAAATLLGLLDRLGLSMAVLRPLRSPLESKIDGSAEWRQARTTGSMKSTFDVLRTTRDALQRCVLEPAQT